MHRPGWSRGFACAALGALAACTTYHPLPLPAGPDVGTTAEHLEVDISQLRVAPLKSIAIDPKGGFTPLQLAVLAVLNNPDLRAKRAALGVSAAQVFAAGLLPDPQITAGVDQPIAGPDTHTAFSISPSIDIAGIIAAATNRRAARYTAKQADLDVLWAEWTTAQHARELAVTVLTNERRAAFLRELIAAAGARATRSTQALARGDVTAQTAAADVAAKLDVEALLATAQHDALKARRDLDAALGLDETIVLPLVDEAPAAGYGAAQIRQDLSTLAARRPDLIALQAGYSAENAKLRQAILAQFPLAQIAFAYARDPTPTTTLGLAAVLALPILNGHRGEVRVQEATRVQLRAEYQARLDATDAEVKNAAAELAGARRQAAVLSADLPRLESMLGPAPAAYARGDIDSQAYLALLQTVITKRADLENNELTARMAEIQLETSLFVPPAGAS